MHDSGLYVNRQKGNEMKNYYNEYMVLINTVKEKEKEDLDGMLNFIEKDYNSFEAYINSIYNMELILPMLKFKYEGQDYRDKVMELDSRRRSAHERAMGACRSINKYCEYYGLDQMFPDYEERSFYTDLIHRVYNDFVAAGKLKKREEFIDSFLS